MQLKNLIVPIVGDFAGPKALRAVGRFVRERGGKVTSFYTSNVEQYLFQNQVWKRYYDQRLDAAARLDQHIHPRVFPAQRRPADRLPRRRTEPGLRAAADAGRSAEHAPAVGHPAVLGQGVNRRRRGRRHRALF